ncbi:hypothetical protein EJC49_16255, partial [Aquibium carbonis]
MTRHPTPGWIDLARVAAMSAGEAAREESDAPAVETPRRGENDNAGGLPPSGLPSVGANAALLP